MAEDVWTRLLATLDFLVLEWLEAQDFRQIGDVPAWFDSLDLGITLSRDRFTLDSELPFLENFLVDAASLWSNEEGRVSSGPWVEVDRRGREFALEATAVSIEERKLLLLSHRPSRFEEKRRIVQRGRELSLQFGRLQRWERELVERQRQLEGLVTARSAELGESKERWLMELAERRKAQETLQKEEEKFRILVEECPFGVLWRRAGKPTYINPAFAQILNCRLEEVREDSSPLSQLLENLAPSSAAGREETAAAKLEHTVVVSKVVTVEGLEKIVRCRPVTLGPMDDFLFIEDITDQTRMEEKLAEAQKMEVVGTLAGGIAHDFNNLLQAIQGYAELLALDRPETDPVHEGIHEIVSAAARGRELTRELLTMSRRLESRQELIDLNETVRRVHRLLGRTLPKMIEMRVALARQPVLIKGDPGQLEQVLMNLVVNARDAMREGGRLTIRTAYFEAVEDDPALAPEQPPGQYVQLTVSDTGTGMDDGTQSRMFEPFFTTKEAGMGTGLGLGMVYGIVKSHRGWIVCDSELGHGTRFHLFFPALHGSLAGVESVDEVPRGGHERILLVEDEAALRRLGEGITARFGYEVVTEPDGEHALERFRREHDSIDLVILDLVMPGMGGQKCLAEMLKIDAQARVIIASGLAEAKAREKLEGARGFVAKPYSVAELLDSIRIALEG